jgi:hypothetical protein
VGSASSLIGSASSLVGSASSLSLATHITFKMHGAKAVATVLVTVLYHGGGLTINDSAERTFFIVLLGP